MTTSAPRRRDAFSRLRVVPALLGATILSVALTSPASADTTVQTLRKHHEDFEAARFSDPTNVDNEWFAFEPGKQWVWEGSTVDDEGEVLPHRVVITATNLTKVIAGVECVVTYDLDFEEGDLVEAENAFFAQDDDGNVWRMGEYPEEYDDGEIIAPAWMQGTEGAIAGIAMRGDPEVGTDSYSQGWAPGVEFTDRGRVREFVAEDCVPVDCYENVLVVEETSLEEIDAFHLKYWVRGVGNTRVGWGGKGEKTQEALELVSLEVLDAEAMVEVHENSLALEKSGFEISPDVYGLSEPMVLRGE